MLKRYKGIGEKQSHTYATTKQNIHFKDLYKDTDNPIFDVVIAYTPQNKPIYHYSMD
jgi:hypothetical protein